MLYRAQLQDKNCPPVHNNFSTRLPVLILNSVFSKISLLSTQVLCWFGEVVPLFHIQPGSEYYKREFCTSKAAAGVGPRCIETRSLAAGLGHRWVSQEGRGVDPAFYSTYSHADGGPAGP